MPLDGVWRQRKTQEVLLLLLKAYEYAQDAGTSVWDFAVEVERLREMGLDDSEFRWLVSKHYVEHALEITQGGDEKRVFQPNSPFKFDNRSCLVLSAQGVVVAQSIRDETQSACPPETVCAPEHAAVRQTPDDAPESTSNRSSGDHEGQPRPVWDSDRHELWLDGRLVKGFRQSSPNQEAILAAFQEENWTACIADPLAPAPGIDQKRRLQSTLRTLNRSQTTPILRFKGDGTGEGVVWEKCGDNGRSRRAGRSGGDLQ